MKALLWLAMAVPFVAAGSVAWAGVPGKPATGIAPVTIEQVTAGENNKFALDLYARLKVRPGNLFFSPYSISSALAMTCPGGRGNTEAEMKKTLHFVLDDGQLDKAFKGLNDGLNEGGRKGAYELTVANALWGQKGYGFLPPFLDLVKKNYGAGLNEVDFAGDPVGARKTINAWVEKQTKGNIKQFVSPDLLDRNMALVLTNAAYFKGKWEKQFKKENTQEAEFKGAVPPNRDSLKSYLPQKVQMMHQRGKFRFGETENLQILEMPYKGGDLSALVPLPKWTEGAWEMLFGEMEKNLSVQGLNELRMHEVDVYLPRFKLTGDFDLVDTLKEMGMKDAFGPNADFSGMTARPEGLFLSRIPHGAFVIVNEEGTEAAAATSSKAVPKSMPERPILFRADHPFIFLIRDNRTGSILFMGRVMNPTE